MSSIKKKTVITTVYLTVAALIAAVLVTFSYAAVEILDDSEDNMNQLDSFVEMSDLMDEASFTAFESTNAYFTNTVRLNASAILYSGIELKPQKYANGYIIRKTEDGIKAPEDFPHMTESDWKALFADESFDEDFCVLDDVIMIRGKIRDDYHYVEQLDGNPFSEELDNALNPDSVLNDLAKASGSDFLLVFVNFNDDEKDNNFVLTSTGKFEDLLYATDIGLDKDLILRASESMQTITIDGIQYIISAKITDTGTDTKLCAIMLTETASIRQRAIEQTLTIVVIMMLICITMSVWILSVFRTVRNKTLTYEENLRYRPDAMKRKVIACLLAGTMVIFLGSMFTQALESLFLHSYHNSQYLSEYFNRIETDTKRKEMLVDQSQIWFNNNAKQVAALLDYDPDLRDPKWLREASDIIGADYIMIFDTNGDELLTSSRYRGVSLGKDEDSATYDFRRLLKGAGYLFLENVTDEVTGDTRDLHGISLKFNSTDKGYGALVIAVAPNQNIADVFADHNTLATLLTPGGDICFGVDPAKGTVISSSDETLLDMNISEIGMKDVDLSSDYMGYLTVDGIDYYAISDQYKGNIYYYGVTKQSVFSNTLAYAVICTLLFIIISAVLALILMRGYTQEEFNKYADIEAAEENDESGADNDSKGFLGDSSRLARLPYFMNVFRKDQTPDKKALSVGWLLFLLYFAFIVIAVLSSGNSATTASTVIGYIARGSWERGINLFAIAAVLLLFFGMIMVMFILKCLSLLLTRIMSEKDQTALQLLINILYYAAIITFIFISLGYLGVNTRAILASAGLAGLALTLGARDLVSDVLAGITTIVDKTYRIGDVIEIGGFRGEVCRMGLRSTTLIGRGKNMKTFRNSNIMDVTNYSRMNSWYPLTLTISSSQSLDDLEKMFEEELPVIGEKFPEIISGPQYRGVESISGDKTSILILTECRQEDFSRVQREVNREILLLFEKHGIKLY